MLLHIHSFHAPPAEDPSALETRFDPSTREMKGVVHVSISPSNLNVENGFRDALFKHGVNPIVDASDGNVWSLHDLFPLANQMVIVCSSQMDFGR